MDKKFNLFSILAILIIPVAAYFLANIFISYNPDSMAFSAGTKPIIMDFSSKLCLECKQMQKILTPLKPKYENEVIFQDINVNSNSPDVQKQIQKYNVNVVPTLIFINQKGKVVRKIEGAPSSSELEGYINKLING